MNAHRTRHLPPAVARVLRGFRRRQQLHALLRIACGTLLLYLLLALATMHADRVLFLTPQTRLALTWAVHGISALAACAALLLLLVRRPSVRRLAYELGTRIPGGDAERYVTLDSVLREPPANASPVHAELLAQLQQATEELSRNLKPGRLARDRWLPRLATAVLAGGLLCAGLAALPGYQFPLMVRRFLAPRANLPKPSFVRIRVTPETPVLGRGEELVLQAAIEGDIPAILAWLYRLVGVTSSRCLMATAPGQTAALRLDPVAARDLSRVQRRLFVFSEAELENSFSFRLRCGDAETAIHFVDVVAQPRVTELRLRVTPPAYTGRPAAEIVNPPQAVQLFPGTQVEFLFTVDQEVPERLLLLGSREGPAPAWDAATRTGRYRFTMQDKLDLEVRVRNARGFRNTERARVSLLRLDDRAPLLNLEHPTADLTVVPGELIPVQALAEDDLAIVQAAFRFQLNPDTNPDAPFQEMPLAVPEPHGTQLALTENFDLAQTTAGPGDELLLAVRVRDSAGNDTESRPVRLRVTAFTRGENERRRLLALDCLHELLSGLADAPPAAAAAAEAALFEAVRKQAAGAGLVLDAAPTLASVCQFLEVEQHFTDAPRHKEDLRELCGVLFAAWRLGDLPAAAPPAATPGATWPRRLGTEVLDPMRRARRLQNVVWRLFGLQFEIADIRRRLTSLEEETARQRAARRTALERFLLGVVDAALANDGLRGTVQRELELRREISDLKAHAARAGAPDGEQVDNPFAPLQLDVEAARLTAEDEAKLAQLTTRLNDTVAGRRRLAADALRDDLGAAAAALTAAGLELTADELETLAATAQDRALLPDPATAAFPAALTPDVRQALVQELADARLRAADAGDAAAQRSLVRRADLYLKALQDLGVDLASATEGTGTLDENALRTLQGELNTAGYYLTRGGRARNIASCNDVSDLLARMLATVRPALPPMLRAEQQARTRLHALYRATWADVAGGAARLGFAAQWTDLDLRLLERNPFGPLAPRLRALARLEAELGAPDAPSAPLLAFLDPDGPAAGAVRDDRRASQLLALIWELESLRAEPRVSAPERAVAEHLLELTAAGLGAAPGADVAAIEKRLLALPLSGAVPDTGAEAFLRAAHGQVDATAAESMLLEQARERLPLGEPLRAAARALTRAQAAVQAVDTLERSLNSGDADVAAALGAATDAIGWAVADCEQLVRLAALDVAYVDPLAPTAAREERLFLRMRESLGRYRGRAGAAVQSLGGARDRELDAAQLGSLGADLTIIKAGVQALAGALQGAVDTYNAGDADDGPRYPALEVYAESRAWLSSARALAGAERGAADVAAAFVQRSAAAQLEYLRLRSAPLAAATRDLEAAAALAEAGTADGARVGASLTALQQALDTFLAAIGRAGAGPLPERCREDAAALHARLAKLARDPAAAQAPVDSRRVLELMDLLKDTQRLLRRLTADAGAGDGPSLEFAGGPDRIWLQETRLDAEVSRQRLLGQLRQARQRFTLGMLDALEAPPGPEACREIVAWSLFRHRAARSPLSGIVTPPRTEAGGESARNPLVAWLLEQLQEAASQTRAEDSLRNYPGISRELIQSLKDYVRY
jgi:hypothetical protein